MTYATHLTPILNVSDLSASFEWFARLGWSKRWDWGDPPDFGAVGSGPCEIFLCRDGQGGRGAHASWMSVWVDDVDAVHAACASREVEILQAPTDEEWGVREMLVRHPDGHVFRFSQPLPADEQEREQEARTAGPPLAIERVEVPVRLERRLAALLEDLAAHKQMSVSSCLEETLLHTFEPVTGGVASPHTQRTLAHIQELKEKHGIDYDAHASYRFVER